MKDYIDTWGEYPGLGRKEDLHLIHPDDRELVESLTSSRFAYCIAHCVGIENEFLLLGYGDLTVRVMPENYVERQTPVLDYGDEVREREDEQRYGRIRRIIWHVKHEREYYLLEIDGRDSSKWQFSDDLELTEPK